ncbi:cyclic pyranopterin monophosphate synthase accessory protein 2 [Methanobrevibacter filiformis]|uniref:Cyclic pyranopterin monophosphate synthase accessory protein 2 n=2 Tax=Methanobrevibacter filiformis TaxID=55758 RepID=A0A166CKB1_9EURY|nr:cyclic pyranopterin monophosphate synthase accessory protein 2 [Methanobrevibacter filiformis]
MVEVGKKSIQKRIAIASGKIKLSAETINMIKNHDIEKGNVLTTAQIAAINAVKNTSNLIPLCHQLQISGIKVDFEIFKTEIAIKISVKTLGQTGVEMEAITGVSVGLLTIWDMVKSVEKNKEGQYPNTEIYDIKVLDKKKT